jgi:hypothetical protein
MLIRGWFKVNLDFHFFFLKMQGTRKTRLFLWTVSSKTVLTSWQMIMHPTSTHHIYYKKVSDLRTPSVEQHCIIKFLAREKVKVKLKLFL